MSERELLTAFMELFPVDGQVVPLVEIKFRLAAKFGSESVEEMLDKLVEDEVLSRFEFNNTVHYKSKKDIPLTLGGGSSASPAADSGQISALSDLVVALAQSSSDSKVKELLAKYQDQF
jgi:hypothetical protein